MASACEIAQWNQAFGIKIVTQFRNWILLLEWTSLCKSDNFFLAFRLFTIEAKRCTKTRGKAKFLPNCIFLLKDIFETIKMTIFIFAQMRIHFHWLGKPRNLQVIHTGQFSLIFTYFQRFSLISLFRVKIIQKFSLEIFSKVNFENKLHKSLNKAFY